MTHFAYLHADRLGGVFYIGKGSGLRHLDFSNRGVEHKERVRAEGGKAAVLVAKLDCSSEETALSLERGLIRCAKRSGIALLNKSLGGAKGPVGYKMPESAKEKLSALKTGFRHSDETKQLMSSRRSGKKKTAIVSESTRLLHSARLKGVAPSPACEKAKVLATSKAVVCVETGGVFPSATSASIFVKRNKKAVANAILYGIRCGGYSWKYV